MKIQLNNSWNNLGGKDRLDLVFENRPKDYGAYKLRQQYNRNKVLAMAISFALVGLFAAGPLLFGKQPALVIKDGPIDTIDTIRLNDGPDKQTPPLPPQTPTKHGGNTPDVPPIFNPNASNPLSPDSFGSGGAPTEGSNGGPLVGSGVDTVANNTGIVKKFVQKKANRDCSFGGDENAFSLYISENFIMPNSCEGLYPEGSATMRFKVDADGSISNIETLNCSIDCPEFIAEIKDLIAHSPNWKPALVNDNYAPCWRVVPIRLIFSSDGN